MRAFTHRSTPFAAAIFAAGLGSAALLASPAYAATADTGSSAATTGTTTTGTASTGTTKTGAASTGAMAAPSNAMQKQAVAHVDARLAKLKQNIGITADEEAAWKGFVQVSESNAGNLSALYDTRARTLDTMTAVQNMESYSAIVAKQADDMNALTASFQTLYTQLKPAQQKKLDTLFRAKAEKHVKKHMKHMEKKTNKE